MSQNILPWKPQKVLWYNTVHERILYLIRFYLKNFKYAFKMFSQTCKDKSLELNVRWYMYKCLDKQETVCLVILKDY